MQYDIWMHVKSLVFMVLGQVVRSAVRKISSPDARTALLMQEYVEAMQRMKEASARGDSTEAHHQFLCASIVCKRIQINEPFDVGARLN